jgi:hypothetical protein
VRRGVPSAVWLVMEKMLRLASGVWIVECSVSVPTAEEVEEEEEEGPKICGDSGDGVDEAEVLRRTKSLGEEDSRVVTIMEERERMEELFERREGFRRREDAISGDARVNGEKGEEALDVVEMETILDDRERRYTLESGDGLYTLGCFTRGNGCVDASSDSFPSSLSF